MKGKNQAFQVVLCLAEKVGSMSLRKLIEHSTQFKVVAQVQDLATLSKAVEGKDMQVVLIDARHLQLDQLQPALRLRDTNGFQLMVLIDPYQLEEYIEFSFNQIVVFDDQDVMTSHQRVMEALDRASGQDAPL